MGHLFCPFRMTASPLGNIGQFMLLYGLELCMHSTTEEESGYPALDRFYPGL